MCVNPHHLFYRSLHQPPVFLGFDGSLAFSGDTYAFGLVLLYSHSYPNHIKQYKELSTFRNSLTAFNLTTLLKIRDSVNVVVYVSVNVKVTQLCLTL